MNFDEMPTEDNDELFQVTAMVDVVFILLAFFVLSVQFHGDERDLALGYVNASPIVGMAGDDLPPAIVVQMTLTDNEQVQMLVGLTLLPINGFSELTQLLVKIDMPHLPVVLAADPQLSVQQVASAMDAVLASPMGRLSLSRLRMEDEL